MDRGPPSKEETRDAYAAAMALAMALTRSRARAEDTVHDAFERLMTTRSWDRSKGPLDRHVMGIVRSLVNIAHRSAAPRNEARAADGYHDEVVGRHADSFEEWTLEQADAEERRAEAATEIDQLAACVVDHAVAPGVLKCRAEGIQKAADIAVALGVPVHQVYRANEILQEHLKKIREAT